MITNLLVLVMDFIPGVPLPYRAIFLAPAIELTNIMACSVFRSLKKENGGNNHDVHCVSAIRFQKNGNVPVSMHSQIGGSTTGSVIRNELYNRSSVSDITMPSNNSHTIDNLARPQKAVISESSVV